MKTITRFAAAAVLLLSGMIPAGAQELIDFSAPDRLISYGVRVGFNVSNQTSPDKALNLDSWGTGFMAGAVVDLNFRDFFALQPGFFFECRSHDYSYITGVSGASEQSEYGHTRGYWFTVPLLAQFRINPAYRLRVSFDAGPMFAFGIGGSDKGTFQYEELRLSYDNGYFNSRRKFNFGFKFGVGARYADHYYLGVHYEAGTGDVYKNDIPGGNHKAWTFTLGYDF